MDIIQEKDKNIDLHTFTFILSFLILINKIIS